MPTDDVRQASTLLERRLQEATVEMDAKKEKIRLKTGEIQDLTVDVAALEEEVKAVSGALGLLQATRATGGADKTDSAPGADARRMSVRAYVLELTEGAYQRWSSAELVFRIDEDIKSGRVVIKVGNLASSVRSAIWALTNDRLLRRVQDDRVVATKWEPDTIPTPAGPKPEEAPSDSPAELASMLSGGHTDDRSHWDPFAPPATSERQGAVGGG